VFDQCVGDTLRRCAMIGSLPTDTACGWGCSSVGKTHCTRLVPSGGGVVRNMSMTKDGNLAMAESGVNRVALVTLQ